MKSPSVNEIKKELESLPPKKVLELCLRLVKFKKENKELSSFLLFEAHNEPGYVESLKNQIDIDFEDINTSSWFFVKKSLRKILRSINKYCRFTEAGESEVELHLYFAKKIKDKGFMETYNKSIINMYQSELNKTNKLIGKLHNDLQFDYKKQVQELEPATEHTGLLFSLFKRFK